MAADDQQPQEISIPNPADAFFKECFSNLPAARDFFRNQLPPALASQADWDALQRQPDSFLDATLRSKFADLLFSVPLRGRKAFLYILLEHKSTPDHWALFHLLELMLRIWRKRLDNSSYARAPLPVIVPFVFHQGPKHWTLSKKFSSYFGLEEPEAGIWRPFIPEFEHLLFDLSRIPWEEIRGEALLRVTLGIMKAVRERQVAEVLPRLAPLLAQLGPSGNLDHFLQALARYLLEVQDMNASTIYHLAHKIEDEKARTQIMTLAENIREEGRQEGRDEGFLIGQIVTFQDILGLPASSKDSLAGQTIESLQAQLAELKAQVSKLLKEQ